MSDRRGLLIILSSPSGAGKSTLARKLRDWDASLQFSVSATTRAPRVGEVDGKDYFFTDEDKFRTMVNDGEMLEHARVFGYHYVLINDDLVDTEARLKSIITAERLRLSQQPNLVDHVRTLQAEFEETK